MSALPTPPDGFRFAGDGQFVELLDKNARRVGWAMREPSGGWLCVRSADGREETAASRFRAGQALVRLAAPG